MKKRLLFVAAICVATATFAQDGLTSKKGEAYLPEAGDWSIGFDATPFLNYAGNLFNNGVNTGVVSANYFAPNGAIYGKMYKDEKTAYRGMLRIGFGSNTVTNNFDTVATKPAVTDEISISGRQIVLGFGIEKHRGNTRIQGVYGAQMMIGFGGGSTTYTYGDNYDINHTAQFTTWSGLTATGTSSATSRTTESVAGSTFMLGIQGFIGVEWFFAPKVSLGAEYGWGLAMNSTGEGETTTESWGITAPATTPALTTNTTKTGKSSSFSLDNSISGASISLNFHF